MRRIEVHITEFNDNCETVGGVKATGKYPDLGALIAEALVKFEGQNVGPAASDFVVALRDTEEANMDNPTGDRWGHDINVLMVQFPRLIAEAEAAGLWMKDDATQLAESMDLGLDDVYALVERAQDIWDHTKERMAARSAASELLSPRVTPDEPS